MKRDSASAVRKISLYLVNTVLCLKRMVIYSPLLNTVTLMRVYASPCNDVIPFSARRVEERLSTCSV